MKKRKNEDPDGRRNVEPGRPGGRTRRKKRACGVGVAVRPRNRAKGANSPEADSPDPRRSSPPWKGRLVPAITLQRSPLSEILPPS